MAALSIGHSIHKTGAQIEDRRPKIRRRFVIVSRCERNESMEEGSKQEGKKEREGGWMRIEKVGKSVKESMRRKEKGDWKDVVLMSLSFGVYVYISQKIVCAYCAWISLLNSNQF